VIETCDGDKKCSIVHSGITVAYAADKEAALIYTINTIKEKMDNGEFDNEDDAISVKYGAPGNHLEHNDDLLPMPKKKFGDVLTQVSRQ